MGKFCKKLGDFYSKHLVTLSRAGEYGVIGSQGDKIGRLVTTWAVLESRCCLYSWAKVGLLLKSVTLFTYIFGNFSATLLILVDFYSQSIGSHCAGSATMLC